MKIVIIGPGLMPIPPTGWGAVEILIHDMRCSLERLGHEVHIVNVKDKNEIIRQTNSLEADFVHVQYDDHIDVVPHLSCKNVAITSHYGYLEQPGRWDPGYHRIMNMFLNTNVDIFALSPGIADIYKRAGFQSQRIHVVHNGVRDDLFRYSEDCEYTDRSMYLAKVDFRKRQHIFQGIPNLFFAGNIADNRFDTTSDRYLGEWSKEHLYDNLTRYSNLVLLSDGEAHPLVCMEAMSAGLGLVISESACGNLDLSRPFIDIIPEPMIENVSYVESIISYNSKKSNPIRKQIREYAETFSWDSVIENVYIPKVQAIVDRNKVIA